MDESTTPWWLWLVIAAVLIALIFGVLYFFVFGRERIDLGGLLDETTPSPTPVIIEPTPTPTFTPTPTLFLREMPQTGI
ncbi:hypothetical protein C4578_03790 [Candidatus Microgenomates bacterium]|jgi:hypothetical protein|nr:MAG: hypothetical protein C4578_03790 [Candidatus Microgenomates bacterium]